MQRRRQLKEQRGSENSFSLRGIFPRKNVTKHVRNVDFAAEQHQQGTFLGQDRQCVYGWVGTKHGWCSPKTGLVPSVPALPGQALHHPRVSQSFPAPASPQDKEAEVQAEDKDVRVGLTVGGRGLLFGHFWPQLWRAFPQERICSCCCSPPLLPGSWSHSKSKASLKSAHKKLLPSHNVSSNCSAREAWLPNRKTVVWRKGKPPRKMAVCFQLASRQGREGHVHQSIEDHRPITIRVDAASSNQEQSSPSQLRPSRTGPWVRTAGFIYQNKVDDWPRSRRRAG